MILKSFLFLCLCSLSSWAATPEVVLKVNMNHQEGQYTSVWLFSKKDQPLSEARICVGAGCSPSGYTTTANEALKKGEGDAEWVRRQSSYRYALKKGDVLNMEYTVQGDSQIHARRYELFFDDKPDSRPEFRMTEEKTVTGWSVVIHSYQHLVQSLMAAGTDANRNGIADNFDVSYYGGANNCVQYAMRAYRACQGWGVPVRMIYYTRPRDGAYHAIIKAFVGGYWHYVEPQFPGNVEPPGVNDYQYSEFELR